MISSIDRSRVCNFCTMDRGVDWAAQDVAQLRQWFEEGRKPMRPDWSLESIKTKLKQMRGGAPDKSCLLKRRRTSEVLAEIETAVTETPRQTLSVLRRHSSLDMSRSTLWSALHQDLQARCFKPVVAGRQRPITHQPSHQDVFEGARNPALHAASVLARLEPTRFSPLARVGNGAWRPSIHVTKFFLWVLEPASALKAPAWTSAQATDCDLESRLRKSKSVWCLSPKKHPVCPPGIRSLSEARLLENTQTLDGMHHDKKKHYKRSTSCRPRSVIRIHEFPGRKNRNRTSQVTLRLKQSWAFMYA